VQVLDTSDLPGGVVNIVTGDRDLLCKTLVEHDDVEVRRARAIALCALIARACAGAVVLWL
jgi:hypothetical protein